MFQLVYLSFASTTFNPKSDVNDILEAAKRNIKAHDITGMLLHKGGAFLQLLEGDKKTIQGLYGKIAMDLRHEGLKVLVKQDAQERLFSEWTMAYKKIEASDLNLMDTILSWQDILNKTHNREAISNQKILEIFKMFRYQVGN